MMCSLFAQSPQNNDEELLSHYVQSKGNNTIVFDSSNIKRFWVDKSVLSRDGSFEITLNKDKEQVFKSVPFRLQLINVNEAQDCKIEIISKSTDFEFSVLNGTKVLSSFQKDDNFINYSVSSSVFHLEDTQNTSFELIFSSKTTDRLSINKMILSFFENKNSSFLSSPGKILFTKNNLITSSSTISEADTNLISVTGKQSIILSSKKIFVNDNTFSTSATIKNIGENAVRIYMGYAVYTKDKIKLDPRNYPYNNINKVLSVVSSSKGDKTIVVDSYTDWTKNCFLALNAKEDMSDIPNTVFVGGRIVDMKKLENGQAEITLEKPLDSTIKEGTTLRVHGPGGAFLYTQIKTLQPEEEYSFSSSIQKDESFLQYTPKAFSRGVYFVIPLILSYSVDPSLDNTVLISNFITSY